MTSTASSESEFSSSELQALKDEQVKVGHQIVLGSTGKASDKRPTQKVPKLSSKELARMKVINCCDW